MEPPSSSTSRASCMLRPLRAVTIGHWRDRIRNAASRGATCDADLPRSTVLVPLCGRRWLQNLVRIRRAGRDQGRSQCVACSGVMPRQYCENLIFFTTSPSHGATALRRCRERPSASHDGRRSRFFLAIHARAPVSSLPSDTYMVVPGPNGCGVTQCMCGVGLGGMEKWPARRAVCGRESRYRPTTLAHCGIPCMAS